MKLKSEKVKYCIIMLTNRYRFMLKPIGTMTIMYTVAIIAIIWANYSYIDDLGRVASGYKGWDAFSRHISEILSKYIHASNYLADILPLPQFLAAHILTISSIAMIHVLSGRLEISVLEMIAALPLGISPYFLECLSYKYDSPYMALSILVSALPLLMVEYVMIAYILVCGQLLYYFSIIYKDLKKSWLFLIFLLILLYMYIG